MSRLTRNIQYLIMHTLFGITLVFHVNIFPQQFSLQITRTLSIEFVELLHYLMYKTNRFRFSVRVYSNHRRRHSVKRNLLVNLFVNHNYYN